MRILVDLDGTICELKKPGQTYADLRVNFKAVEKLTALKKAGHYIILYTARHMKTCNGDINQVIAKVGQVTIDWLKRHKVPYDELHFGKPYAEVYLDDLSLQFLNWDAFRPENLDQTRVNILITMAGAGSRFIKAGFSQPKALIIAKDKPLIEWAMKSFEFLSNYKNKRFIFIVLKDHIKKYNLDKELIKLFGKEIIIVPVPSLTRGQAETALLAKSLINNFQKLFIFNCDTFSQSPIWELIQNEDPDGVIEIFESTDPRYSFAKLDEYGFVSETAEKKVISNLASTGMYYFKRGADFILAAENLISRNKRNNNEFYVMPCYNELIKSGKRIKTIKATTNWVIGTPEELANFEKFKHI